ncbi:MAG: hypothetical protein PWP76_321 [Candidatus Diapherotrites archaeon]|nr:hypothetical protein [Candidatus Diapherotrites archaeon]MDN5366691.1 hypothetical protein [Candidatus Diapherotrites archaeon]
MRWILPIILLALLSVAQAYVLVYANGFDYRQNYGKDVYVEAGTPEQIVSTWQDWGFEDVVLSNKIDTAADGIIILGCTDLDEEDMKKLDEYVKNGGRVVLDLYCPGRLDDFVYQYGIIRSDKPYQGTILQTLKLPYVEVKGYPVDKPIVMRETPVNSKYVGMTYVGPAFTATSEVFSDVFLTPTGQSVAFIGRIGSGTVYVTGCLLCSNQLLMANILDWVGDGKIDFPAFEVDRRIYPPIKKVGEPFYDEIRITVPPEEAQSLEITVAYPYNEEGFCKLTPVQQREQQGNTVIFKFEYYPEDKMNCQLAPVMVSINWISPKGKILREFTVPGEYIQVITTGYFVPPSKLPYAVAAIIVIVASFSIVLWTYRERKKVKEMRLRLEALEESLKDLQKKFMTRQITEDVYKRLTEKYLAEMEELKTKLKMLEKEKK